MTRPAGGFRDRFFTPPVARAVTSPSGILAAGAGAAVGIVVLGPLGAVLGVGAWAVRVLVAVPRRAQRERIDPFALGEPWRRFVHEAQQARAHFDDAVRSMSGGPLKDHLTQIGERLADGAEECWRVARRGAALADARQRVDDRQARADLASDEVALQQRDDTTIRRTVEALQAQVDTADRMDRVISDTVARLRLLDARMDESVSRAVELSVQADSIGDLGGLSDEVDGLVGEMEALRQALDETTHPSDRTQPGYTSPGPAVAETTGGQPEPPASAGTT